jgi:outer membrane biogenesis lipoprotein LolB
VLGLPDPNVEYKARLDAAGGLIGFEQQDWALAFESFDAVGDLALPKKMSIRGGAVTLKLIADEWVVKQ